MSTRRGGRRGLGEGIRRAVRAAARSAVVLVIASAAGASAADFLEVEGTARVTADESGGTPVFDGDLVRVRVEYGQPAPQGGGDGVCNVFQPPIRLRLEVPAAGIDVQASPAPSGPAGFATVCDDQPGSPGWIDSVRWGQSGPAGSIGGLPVGSVGLTVAEELAGTPPDLVTDNAAMPGVSDLDLDSPAPDHPFFVAEYVVLVATSPAQVALRIENPVVLVPEPGPLLSLAAGAGVLALLVARRRA